VPQVKVPDLHGLGDKDIKHKLDEAGLVVGHKNDTCTGPDKGDPKVRKGRVLCQNPPAGTSVSAGSAVDYTLAGR
jgi:beta-lactam-binding protein with PASTA domain